MRIGIGYDSHKLAQGRKLILGGVEVPFEKGLYATDDAALVEDMGGKIRVIPGSPYNIKVTVPEDMDMVEFFLMKERQER